MSTNAGYKLSVLHSVLILQSLCRQNHRSFVLNFTNMETSVQKTIDNDTRLQFRYSMLARILSGYNNDYFRSKPFRFFARLYTFLLATMFTVIVLMQYDRIYVYMLLVSHVQFLMNYLVSMMTGDRYFFDYCSKIREFGIKENCTYLSIIRFLDSFLHSQFV